MADVLSSEQTQRSLWLGDLPQWIDEGQLYNLFVVTGQLVSVKLIRNRSSGLSEGYAFLEFRTHEAAAHVLSHWNGQPFPNDPSHVFRLNWAAYGVGRSARQGEDFSLFVGDLAPDVTDLILQEYFRQFYPSVRSAKVITDVLTGRSKGYGFVRFLSEEERDKALETMGGHFLSNRPIRVHLATPKKSANATMSMSLQAPHPSDFDTSNTTLFIGGLSSRVTEDDLRGTFGRFGDIIYVKIPAGKGCGFVQFVLRVAAEQAMAALNGATMGGAAIRISWGRSSSRAANAATLAGLPGFGAAMGGSAAVAAADPRAFSLYDPGAAGPRVGYAAAPFAQAALLASAGVRHDTTLAGVFGALGGAAAGGSGGGLPAAMYRSVAGYPGSGGTSTELEAALGMGAASMRVSRGIVDGPGSLGDGGAAALAAAMPVPGAAGSSIGRLDDTRSFGTSAPAAFAGKPPLDSPVSVRSTADEGRAASRSGSALSGEGRPTDVDKIGAAFGIKPGSVEAGPASTADGHQPSVLGPNFASFLG